MIAFNFITKNKISRAILINLFFFMTIGSLTLTAALIDRIVSSYNNQEVNRSIHIKRAFANLNLRSPRAIDEYKDKYYILDDELSIIAVLDKKTGNELNRLGKPGQGPGELFNPGYMKITGGIICIFEHRNKRFQFLKVDGSYLSEFPDSPFPWRAFSMDSNGKVYLGQPQKGNLINIYDFKGRDKGAFGKLKEVEDIYGSGYAKYNQQYKNAINRVIIFNDFESDDKYVVFIFAPIVQRYDKNGKLIAEATIESKEVDEYRSYFPITTKPTALIKSPMDGVTIYNYFLGAVVDHKSESLILLTGRGNLLIYDKINLKKKSEVTVNHSLYQGAIYDLFSVQEGVYFTTVIQPGIYRLELNN